MGANDGANKLRFTYTTTVVTSESRGFPPSCTKTRIYNKDKNISSQQKQNNSIQLIGPLVIKEIPKISNNGQIILLCCFSNARIISMSVTEGSKYNTVLTL